MPQVGIVQRLWTERPRLVLSLLLLCALLSAAVGIWNGSHRSQDFQYSGERVLLQHVDPWADFLAGDPHHDFPMTQIPNYLPILYVVLVPYGLLSLAAARTAWAFTNLLFAIVSGRWAARFYGIRGPGVVAVVCLLLMATATRNTLGNGQQGLLVLFLWSLMLWFAERRAGGGGSVNGQAELLGASYFKFTFGPPVLLFVLFRWGIRAALFTLVPAMMALVLVWFWLGHDPRTILTLATEPLAVAKHGFTPDWGDPNLMNVSEILMRNQPENLKNGIELALALLVCVPLSFIAFRRHREGSLQWHMALLATMSYRLFKHHSYDAVVLLFPLCYGLSKWRERAGRWVVGLLSYLFYGERVLDAAHLHPWWFCVPDFLVLMGVLILTYRLGTRYATDPSPHALDGLAA
jgi:hypothetical protein